MRRLLPRLLLAGTLLAAGAPAAQALDERALQRKLDRQMRHAGKASGAYVVDLTTGRRLYARRGMRDRIPASNEKLWTGVAALEAVGDAGFLRTTALAERPVGSRGRLDGDLYLRGEGDPTLTTARLEALAQEVADTGLRRVTGRVVGDDTAFDSLRGPFTAGIGADVGGPLGALVVDRLGGADPAAYAASVFARELRDAGVRVSRRGRSGATPKRAVTLADRRSPSMAAMVEVMNVYSDNFVAEMLLKVVADRAGGVGTTRDGARFTARLLRRDFAITPRVRDGSGLARSNRTNPREVVALLGRLVDDPAFYGSLAVMGVSGTLEERLQRDRARGRCRGKTGTLRDVSALSGYCRARNGDVLAFSILMNRVYVPAARSRQDRMVRALVRYE